MRPHLFTPLVLLIVALLGVPAAAFAADALFWASGGTSAPGGTGGLWTTDLAGSAPPASVWGVSSVDLVYDRYFDRLFWGDGDNVYFGASDGSGSPTFVASVLGTPVDLLALDPVGGMIYWANWSGSVNIYRALASGGPSTLVASPVGIRDIAIDPRPGHRKIYYADGPRIYQSTLDGAPSFTPLGNDFSIDLASIAIDTCANKFIVIGQVDPHPGTPTPYIMEADLADGANQRTLLSGYSAIGCTNPIDDASGLAVDANHQKIYWSSHTCSVQPIIRMANRDGTNPVTIVTQGSSTQWIRGVQVKAPPACPSICIPPFVLKWGSAGGANGQFSSPYGVATSRAGDVYVTDAFNHRVQKFNSSGTFILAWGSNGTGDGQFQGPLGIAVNSAGDVYVTESGNRVQKFDSNGGFLLKWGSTGSGDGQFDLPRGIATDNCGNVYVVEQNNQRVQKFDSNGNFLLKWGSAGSGDGQFNNAWGIAVDSKDNVYVSETNNNRIQIFTAGGVFEGKWGTAGSGDGQFNNPRGVEVDAQDRIYVADLFNNRVQVFDGIGTFLGKWGTSGSGDGQFNQLEDVAVSPAGEVYVADTGQQRIQKFACDGTVSICLPPSFFQKWGSGGSGNGQFSSPYGMATSRTGDVYVTDAFNHRVQKFTSSGAFVLAWGSNGTGDGQFQGPLGIAVSPSGDVYVSESGDRVQKFDANGNFLLKWGSTGSGSGQFSLPRGVAVDGCGNVYVVEQTNQRVQKFDSNGNALLMWGSAGSGNGQFNNPWGIAVDARGNVYVSDTNNSRVQVFTTGGVYVSQWGTAGSGDGQFNNPRGVEVDAVGRIYVADLLNNRIQAFTSVGGFLGKWGTSGSGDGQFNQPEDVAFSPTGEVYVADTGNQRIEEFGCNGVLSVIDDHTHLFGSLMTLPNPFTKSTAIALTMTHAVNHATISVLDVSGRVVRTLHQGPLAAGARHFTWDGSDARGRQVGSGIYFVTARTGQENLVRRVVHIQ